MDSSDAVDIQNTHVVELYSRLEKDDKQLTYYDSGIGTYARPSFRSFSYLKQVIYNLIDTAIAWFVHLARPVTLRTVTYLTSRNFERIIHAAYKWLSENYQPGDRIFLFGT